MYVCIYIFCSCCSKPEVTVPTPGKKKLRIKQIKGFKKSFPRRGNKLLSVKAAEIAVDIYYCLAYDDKIIIFIVFIFIFFVFD